MSACRLDPHREREYGTSRSVGVRSVLRILAAGLLIAVSVGSAWALDLTPEQKSRLQDLVRETKSETASVRRALFEKRRSLVNIYADWRLDEKKARENIKAIGDLQRRLLELNLENQLGLRRILDREQFESFRGAIRERDGRWGRRPSEWAEHTAPGDLSPRGFERLRLAPDQLDRVRRLFRAERSDSDAPLRRLQRDTETVRRLYLDYSLDEKKLRDLLDRINQTQREVMENSLNRQIEIRKILSEDQFNALMAEVRRGMQNRYGHGPRRR